MIVSFGADSGAFLGVSTCPPVLFVSAGLGSSELLVLGVPRLKLPDLSGRDEDQLLGVLNRCNESFLMSDSGVPGVAVGVPGVVPVGVLGVIGEPVAGELDADESVVNLFEPIVVGSVARGENTRSTPGLSVPEVPLLLLEAP